jgi:hypothetical protein
MMTTNNLKNRIGITLDPPGKKHDQKEGEHGIPYDALTLSALRLILEGANPRPSIGFYLKSDSLLCTK